MERPSGVADTTFDPPLVPTPLAAVVAALIVLALLVLALIMWFWPDKPDFVSRTTRSFNGQHYGRNQEKY